MSSEMSIQEILQQWTRDDTSLSCLATNEEKVVHQEESTAPDIDATMQELVRLLEICKRQTNLQKNDGDDKVQPTLDEQVCIEEEEEESSEEEEEEEWIDHPSESPTSDGNFLHTLNQFLDEATLQKRMIDMDTRELLDLLNTCGYMLCSLYQVSCRYCWSLKHINFQCTKTFDEVIASYNNSSKINATEDVIRYVLRTSAEMLLSETKMVQVCSKGKLLDWIHCKVDSIIYICQEHLCDEETSQDDTNLQEQEYDDDSSLEELDANESFMQETHPQFEEDDYQVSVSDNDKLEEENTFDSSVLMSSCALLDEFVEQGKPLGSVELPTPNKEFYEVFPYKGSQGKISNYIYKSLTLLLQKYKETCSSHLVHRFSLKCEDIFTYMMPMHRKRVRLRPDFAMRCSKPRSEVRHTLRVDIPWDPGE